jgi:hypothetical protein
MRIEKLPDIVIVFAPKVSVAPDDLFTVIVALTSISLAPPTEALSAPVKFSGTPIPKVPLLIRLPLSVSEPLDPSTVPATVSERMVTAELIVRVVPESTTKLSSPLVKTLVEEGLLPPCLMGYLFKLLLQQSLRELHLFWSTMLFGRWFAVPKRRTRQKRWLLAFELCAADDLVQKILA